MATTDSTTLDHSSPTPPVGAPMSTARLSMMMFLEFFIWGSWYVTTGSYMAENGMEGLIGHAYSVGPIAAIISPLFLGLIADRYFASERVLGVLHILAGASMFAAPYLGGYVFIGVLLLHMLCFMPTLGLTNTVAFHHIVNREKTFPIVRVFGTVGWILAGWLISYLDYDTSSNQYFITAIASLALGLYSFTLPHTPAPLKGEKVTVASTLGLDAMRLLKKPDFAVFIAASLLICIPLSAYYAFAAPYVNASGAFASEDGTTNVAFYMSFGQMSEFGFMLLMPLFFARLGVKWMLLVGMGAWVLRYGLFAGAAGSTESAAFVMILGGILLHGICYDFFFVTGQIYTDQKSGPKIRGQAQGFLVLVTQGVGMLIGAQIAQRLFNRTVDAAGAGWGQFWLIPCAMAGVVAILFLILFRSRGTDEPETPARGFEPVVADEVEDKAKGPVEAGLPPVQATSGQ